MWTYVVVGLLGVAAIAIATLAAGLLAALWMLKQEQQKDLERDAASGM